MAEPFYFKLFVADIARREESCESNGCREVSPKLKEANAKERKFDDVVKFAEQSAVLVLVYWSIPVRNRRNFATTSEFAVSPKPWRGD